jgi:hypothetical protein
MLTGKLTTATELTQPQCIACLSAVRSLAAALQPDALQTSKQPPPSVHSVGTLPQLDVAESLQALVSAFTGCDPSHSLRLGDLQSTARRFLKS